MMDATKPTSSPRVIRCADAESASLRVAELIADAVRRKPNLVLGLATGGTPVETYRQLVVMHRKSELDFSDVTSFNLDEYIGLGPEHPQSFRFFMHQQLFDQINIPADQTHVPDGLASDLEQHVAQYEQSICDAGGIDLQLLGIGHNGHIAFNEPGASQASRTRVVDLTEDTIEINSRFFDSSDDVPRTAITMGIGTILEAKRIVLLATGEGKAEAVRKAIEGDVTPQHPASFLQLHDDVLFVLDQAAASRLQRTE